MDPIRHSTLLNNSVAESQKMASTGKITDREQLKKLSGAMWECVSLRPAEGGGYYRTYRADPNVFFKHVNSLFDVIFDQIYPAIEPDLDKIPETIPQRQNPDDPTSSVASTPLTVILKDLGFSFWYVDNYKNSCHMELPDREALLASWSKLQAKYGLRDELTIASSQGKEENLTYVQAIRDHVCLLSHDKEFVHDMFFHIIPAIVTICQCSSKSPTSFQEYLANRSKKIDEILKPLKEIIFLKSWYGDKVDSLPPRIQNLLPKIPALKAMLGIYVDNETSKASEFLSFDEQVAKRTGKNDALFYRNVLQNILEPEPGTSLNQQFLSLKKELMDAYPEIQEAFLTIQKSAPIPC